MGSGGIGKQAKCLSDMGIDLYVRRELTDTVLTGGQSPPADTAEEHEPAADPKQKIWDKLQAEVSVCTRCVLHERRTQTVFGVGNQQADWMLIGEGPGFEEDRQGEPFVGRAGQLLNKMLVAIGLQREQVYIANVVKCRPPENRNPRPEEIAQCGEYLLRQVKLVQPKLMLALGGVAANTLLEIESPVGRLRGHMHHFRDTGIPLVVTYHPAYLLRSPQKKRDAWDDLKMACKVVAGELA